MSIPDCLVWEITKRNSSFLVTKNGKTKRSGTITFSSDPMNLSSVNSYKNSGIANSKAIGFDGQTLVTKQDGKLVRTDLTTNRKKAYASIASLSSDSFYRSDLSKAARAKYSSVLSGKYRKFKCKTGRTSSK
jgi:large subunit ribosomal protein L28e